MVHADSGQSDREMAFLARANQLSKMVDVAASLGIADRIDDLPRPIEELARDCAAHTGALLRLCRGLGAFGIFAVDQEGRVGHTSRSRMLRKDASPTYYYATRYWGQPSSWACWSELEYCVRTGRPSFQEKLGEPFFDYLRSHPEEGDIFDKFMQNSPDDRHNAVAEAYDFSWANLVVDVGGGNGALLAAILSHYPTVSGSLFDQPSVVAAAGAVLGAVADRCRIDPGSFFERVTEGGDVYTVSQVLHDWDDEHCLTLLGNIHSAMHSGSRLLIIERILSEDPDPLLALNYLSDMQMLVLFPGASERTTEEYGRLLAESGFGPPHEIMTRSPFYILEALPLGK